MKITQIVSTYPPYKGGMGNVAWSMVQELRKKGHDCQVLTPGENLKPWLKYGNAAFVPQIYGRLKDAEVIHLHYPFFGGAETVLLYKLLHRRKPLVLTYHMDVIGQGIFKLLFKLYRYTIWPLLARVADVITVSSLDYAQNSQVKPYLSKVQELPFGVPWQFQPKAKPKKHRGLQVLFVATLDKAHYFKGLEVLLQAFKVIDFYAQLKIVGEGNLRKYYEGQVKTWNLSSRVQFLGSLKQDELITTYQNADVTVLPSLDQSEAFGLVLIESMACGTPVIASNLPGVRSVLDLEKTGYLIQPGQVQDLVAKLKLMTDNHPYLYGNCLQWSKNYRWPQIISRLENIYENCLNH